MVLLISELILSPRYDNPISPIHHRFMSTEHLQAGSEKTVVALCSPRELRFTSTIIYHKSKCYSTEVKQLSESELGHLNET